MKRDVENSSAERENERGTRRRGGRCTYKERIEMRVGRKEGRKEGGKEGRKEGITGMEQQP